MRHAYSDPESSGAKSSAGKRRVFRMLCKGLAVCAVFDSVVSVSVVFVQVHAVRLVPKVYGSQRLLKLVHDVLVLCFQPE